MNIPENSTPFSLSAEFDGPAELCPTINRWPPNQIDSEDPESRYLFQVLLFYWKTNTLIANLKDTQQADRRAQLTSQLDDHLKSKVELDQELALLGTHVEPELAGGTVANVWYNSPRGNWNTETGMYDAESRVGDS